MVYTVIIGKKIEIGLKIRNLLTIKYVQCIVVQLLSTVHTYTIKMASRCLETYSIKQRHATAWVIDNRQQGA